MTNTNDEERAGLAGRLRGWIAAGTTRLRHLGSGNASLVAKLTVALLALLLLLTAVTGGAIRAGTTGLRRDLRALNDARRVQELAVTALALVLTQDDITKAMLLDPANLELAVEKVDAHERNIAVYATMDSISRSRELTDRIRRLRVMDEEQLAPLDAQVLGAMAEGDMRGATRVYFQQYMPVRTSYARLVRELGAVADSAARGASDRAATGTRAAFLRITLALVVGMTLIGVLTLYAGRRLRRQLGETVTVLEAVAGGDLTGRLAVASHDEIGRMRDSLNTTVAGLRVIIGQVKGMSAELAEHSHELSSVADEATGSVLQLNAAIEQITTGAQEQARATQETVVVIGEMTSSVHVVAEGAQALADSAARTVEVARAGADTVHAAQRGMAEIQEGWLATEERIRALGGYSDRIDDITRVMSHLAAQTKLLALNAAIEAARAGEHGRGFAVVADEVGRLAAQSAQSSREISGLVADIRDGIERVVSTMNASTDRVEDGMRLSQRTAQALEGILAAVDGTNQQLMRVSASAQEMTTRIARVTGLVQGVANVAEESAAAAQEMAAQSAEVEHAIASISSASIGEGVAPVSKVSARALVRMAGQLRELVASFSV